MVILFEMSYYCTCHMDVCTEIEEIWICVVDTKLEFVGKIESVMSLEIRGLSDKSHMFRKWMVVGLSPT